MSVIKQLMENGEPQYMKAHVKGVDGLPEKLDEYVDKASDETITGQKKFEKVPNVSANGSDQPVLAGCVSYTFSAADIFQEYKSTITAAGGKVYRFANIVIVAANITTKDVTVATKALRLPEGFRLSKNGVYQIGLEVTRNNEQKANEKCIINTDDNSAIRILTGVDGNGSNYVTGMFVTDDPFPVG